MNPEKIYLGLLLLVTAYAFIATVMLLTKMNRLEESEEVLIDSDNDKMQLAQALKETRETKKSPVKCVLKSVPLR